MARAVTDAVAAQARRAWRRSAVRRSRPSSVAIIATPVTPVLPLFLSSRGPLAAHRRRVAQIRPTAMREAEEGDDKVGGPSMTEDSREGKGWRSNCTMKIGRSLFTVDVVQ